jgi:hypothetical protein
MENVDIRMRVGELYRGLELLSYCEHYVIEKLRKYGKDDWLVEAEV